MSIAIREHWEFVLGLARRVGYGRLDPEDLAQDVFERWLRAAPRLAPATNARAWMTVVLRHLAIDRLRSQRAAREVVGDCSWLPAPDREVEPWWHQLDAGDVERMLDALPSAQRSTFQLFELQGKSYDEIARELQIAKATVGVRVLRARRRLKQLLSERGAGAGEVG